MADTPSVKILAVDDESLNNDLLQRTFHDHPHYDVRITSSAADALAYLEQGNDVDILLVDQLMPSMTGTDFVRELHRRGLKPLVVMVTAFPELTEVIDVWQEGLVRGIVPKPWRSQELLRVIDRFASKING